MNGYNFTESVRRALSQARTEACELRHDYVGTEHVLLGLIHGGDNLACAMLQSLGVDLGALREILIATIKPGRAQMTGPDLPYTSRAKKILELAMTEAREDQHSHVGTEHLLIAVMREDKGIAAQMLADVGVTTDAARTAMRRALDAHMADGLPSRAIESAPPATRTVQRDVLGTLPYRLRRVIGAAYDVAAGCQSLQIAPPHVMIALLEHDEGLANAVLDRLGIDRQSALEMLYRLAPRGVDVVGPDDVVTVHETLRKTLDAMTEWQDAARAPTPGTQFLLLGLVDASAEVAAVLEHQSISLDRIREEIYRISG